MNEIRTVDARLIVSSLSCLEGTLRLENKLASSGLDIGFEIESILWMLPDDPYLADNLSPSTIRQLRQLLIELQEGWKTDASEHVTSERLMRMLEWRIRQVLKEIPASEDECGGCLFYHETFQTKYNGSLGDCDCLVEREGLRSASDTSQPLRPPMTTLLTGQWEVHSRNTCNEFTPRIANCG